MKYNLGKYCRDQKVLNEVEKVTKKVISNQGVEMVCSFDKYLTCYDNLKYPTTNPNIKRFSLYCVDNIFIGKKDGNLGLYKIQFEIFDGASTATSNPHLDVILDSIEQYALGKESLQMLKNNSVFNYSLVNYTLSEFPIKGDIKYNDFSYIVSIEGNKLYLKSAAIGAGEVDYSTIVYEDEKSIIDVEYCDNDKDHSSDFVDTFDPSLVALILTFEDNTKRLLTFNFVEPLFYARKKCSRYYDDLKYSASFIVRGYNRGLDNSWPLKGMTFEFKDEKTEGELTIDENYRRHEINVHPKGHQRQLRMRKKEDLPF